MNHTEAPSYLSFSSEDKKIESISSRKTSVETLRQKNNYKNQKSSHHASGSGSCPHAQATNFSDSANFRQAALMWALQPYRKINGF